MERNPNQKTDVPPCRHSYYRHSVHPSDSSSYSRPLPWVGLYVATASLVCFLGLSIDLHRSIRRGKLWVTSNFFSLNAATLTIIAVATKLPSDITTEMPGSLDLLSKVSGIVLLCVAMNHIMPSLGHMSRTAVVSNMIALGILVFTLSVDVWIQLGTGLMSDDSLFTLLLNVLFNIPMLILFCTLVSYALTVPTIMRIQEEKYVSQHEQIQSDVKRNFDQNVISTERLLDYLTKYWLMALTSSPDYTMRCTILSLFSSWICHAVVAFFALMFIGPPLLDYLHGRYDHDSGLCAGSDYKWSIPQIIATQTAAIVVGTIVSILRSSNTGLIHMVMGWKELFRIEKHWIQLVKELRDTPLPLEKSSRRVRMHANVAKNCALSVLLRMQIWSLVLLKVVFFVGGFVYHYFIAPPLSFLTKFITKLGCGSSIPSLEHEQNPPDPNELKDYVLQVGQDRMMTPEEVVRRWWKQPANWYENGGKQKPTNLSTFLQPDPVNGGSNITISDLIPRDSPECYSLPLATLSAIARVMLQDDVQSKVIMCAISEGMRYARFVERSAPDIRSTKMREAANMVWVGVDLFHRWLKIDLPELVLNNRESCERLKKLRDGAGSEQSENGSPREWSSEKFAKSCMRRATSKMLPIDGDALESQETMSRKLKQMIDVVLRQCLSKLPQAIIQECYRRNFGDREEGVREAALVLGETEDLLDQLKILKRQDPPGRYTVPSIAPWMA